MGVVPAPAPPPGAPGWLPPPVPATETFDYSQPSAGGFPFNYGQQFNYPQFGAPAAPPAAQGAHAFDAAAGGPRPSTHTSEKDSHSVRSRVFIGNLNTKVSL